MLLNMIVHQPQALIQVVTHTPYWVWGLLAALVGLGASQLYDRTASLRRTQLMPLGMAVFSVAGVLSAFGSSAPMAVQAVGAWLAAAAAITALALWFQPTAPTGTLYASSSRSFYVPGSAMPLALIVGIFLTKYFVGVELAMQPSLARDGAFALQISALYGVFNGLFAARALRMWRLAQQSVVYGAAPVGT
ncbi:hypothetical protein ASE52_08965 [Acidovorax sp. Root275]|uniref:DUF6622 family protein n=1 Tax=Acidovorax sp. Root275 TaxID=1736508 RepID=UPI00070F47D0|nr:DUF6622 family protein [Acidovorax sp. Root275]KRD50326.1 hypothetical protein ASE52_08965 [Acidovorax sp. Root275]